ncbi:MAG: phenylalanine--tRNA ligase subunit beta [Deltaproteobacteria bacterium]|nr:phenylalanine--tRNA ligase subunit beta [Deltaproteobacteria bacterium]
MAQRISRLKASPRTIADRLTNTGIEIEAIEKRGEGFEGVVVGHVLKVDRHPNADRLSLCLVTDGKETYSIVCGAPNVTVGKKYPLALLGAKLPNGMEIKQAKIRGIDSFGMLCSAKELGVCSATSLHFDEGTANGLKIHPDHLGGGPAAGLLELDDDAPVGKPFSTYYGLSDTILDVAVPPNRGDLLSHQGMAREISAVFSLSLKEIKKQGLKGSYSIKDYVMVKVEDSSGCPRYSSRVIRGIRIAPSPRWLQTRLELLGLRPVNNVVDATNYVMLETGHPLHAFDHRFIRGGVLMIKKAGEVQSFETLDHEKRELLKDDLVIADESGPVALAGIMGGKNSEVRDDTEALVLEAASFHPGRIRSTARRLGIQSESSYRFERGVNPETVPFAINRLAALITALAGGEVSRDWIDISPKKIKPVSLILRQSEIERVLGIAVKPAEVKRILGRLGLKQSPAPKGAPVGVRGGVKATVPSYRRDLTREIDLIEEVIRFTGFEKIPSALPPVFLRSKGSADGGFEETIRNFFIARGFFETIHYSFCGPKDLEKGGYGGPVVPLSNPLTKEWAVLRPTLLPALLETYKKNRAHTDGPIRLFEIRSVFAPPSAEVKRLSGISGGPLGPKNWREGGRVMDFFDGKGVLEEFFRNNRIFPIRFQKLSRKEYHPGQSVAVYAGEDLLGCFGKVHPALLLKYEIMDPVFAFDLDYAALEQKFRERKEAVFKPLSPYPRVVRDLALVMDLSLSHEAILQAIHEAHVPALKEAALFDVYQGEKLPAGKKSLAFSLVYEDPEKTLTDAGVNEAHFALVERLTQKLGVALR